MYLGMILVVAIGLSVPTSVYAQITDTSQISVAAIDSSSLVTFDFDSVGVYSEVYQNQDTVVGERPPTAGRVFLRGSGSFWGVRTNVDLFVSSELRSDMQDINRFSLEAQKDWFQFYLGDHYPMYSQYTLNGVQTRGLGIMLSPGNFRFQINVGQNQRAYEGDSAAYRPGMYRRWMYATRMGFENEEYFYTHIGIVKLKDEPSSINVPFGTTPQENLMGGWDIGFKLWERLRFKSEFVLSANTRDLESAEIDIEKFPSFLKSVFKEHTSSSFDYMFKEDLRLNFENSAYSAYYSRVNSGFNSLGVGFLLSDWQEYRLDSRFYFMDRRLNLGLFHGQRWNNLSSDRSLTTNQKTVGTMIVVRPTNFFYVNTTYLLLLETNDASSDSLARDNITHTLFIQPSVDIFLQSAVHHFDLVASIQTLNDRKASGLQVYDFSTLNLGANYMLSLPLPLTVFTGYNLMLSETALENSTRHSGTVRLLWTMFKNRLSNGLHATFTSAKSVVASILDNNRWDFVLNLTYRLSKADNIRLDGRQTIYSDKVGKSYNEFVGYLRYTRGL
jgi:hypothetical protein